MATSMNMNSQQENSTVGLLLIIGDIISNEQRKEICSYLQRAFQHIDNNKYHEITDLFNNLIHENEFQADSQCRQMANTENGSIAGFLYLPSFHTLFNVLKDLFNSCYHVCIIYCGQQIDSNGALILSDSIFTCENFHSLFEENSSYHIQDLEIILPFISNQWIRLSNNYLQKQLQNVQINDLSNEINQENSFGELFYERLYKVLNKESVNFDIYTKLIPKDSSGTIAFDEPNLYILYGQQGEASLFGIRGFVVLVNGGFSRIPSYWNLIRGLQNIDACILTHFDYDVFPGLQTILHRKTIPSPQDGQLCKPDIGAIFLNHIQRMKIQSIKSSSNSKLLTNLTENIDQFLNNIKQLNIETFDLIKHTIPNKSSIEPINLYKKIAFGSLDLYVLHPTASISEDEKVLAVVQKIPIRDQQPSSSIIPLHHWYSSCSLLVWTPTTSKSNKDSLVRILYTGACPQTLVFEALNRVRHLEFLHESQGQQQQTNRASNIKTTLPADSNGSVKHPPQKPKVSPPIINRVAPTTIRNKTAKIPPNPTISKPKIQQTTTLKPEKPRSAPTSKKTPPPATSGSARPMNKDKKVQKPRGPVPKTSTKPKPVKNLVQTLKTQNDQKQKEVVQNGHKEESQTHADHEQKLETQIGHPQQLVTGNEHSEQLVTENEHEQKPETEIDDEQKLETEIDDEPKLETEIDDEPKLETEIDDEPKLETEIVSEQKLETETDEEQILETEIDDEPKLETEIVSEQKLETETDEEQILETEIDDEPKLETDIVDEPKPEAEVDEKQEIRSQIDEHEQSNNIEQSISLQNNDEEQREEKNEGEMSADELNENDEISTDNHEDEVKRPESVSLINGHNEPFVESSTASPMDEIKSQLSPHDPMTTSFVDGDPDTQNPFNEQNNDDNDDEMEIIHHDISTSNKYSMPSIEEIHPQGLPIENDVHSVKPIVKKSNNGFNRINGSSVSVNNTNQVPTRKPKQVPASGSIFHVDVAYVPYHGNEHYVDSEFFRRIRARYYILNAVQINHLTLESLIDGKQQWGKNEHIPITLVPTFDGEELRQFFVINKNRLAELNINILPAATRCNVQYDDEGSPAQRLRFSSIYNTDEQ